jgi:hypothetical protein
VGEQAGIPLGRVMTIRTSLIRAGDRYGHWTIVDRAIGRPGKSCVLVRCVCGKERVLVFRNVRIGATRSCGCVTGEGQAGRSVGVSAPDPTIPVRLLLTEAIKPMRHGMSGSGEYGTWREMLRRCYEPTERAYASYGGRGITVHAPWRSSFEAFFAHVGPKPGRGYSLDRINNDGNYEPGNVRWATAKEQAYNKRNNRRIAVGNENLTITEWAARLGVSTPAVIVRIRNGWDPVRAVTTPRMSPGRTVKVAAE